MMAQSGGDPRVPIFIPDGGALTERVFMLSKKGLETGHPGPGEYSPARPQEHEYKAFISKAVRRNFVEDVMDKAAQEPGPLDFDWISVKPPILPPFPFLSIIHLLPLFLSASLLFHAISWPMPLQMPKDERKGLTLRKAPPNKPRWHIAIYRQRGPETNQSTHCADDSTKSDPGRIWARRLKGLFASRRGRHVGMRLLRGTTTLRARST